MTRIEDADFRPDLYTRLEVAADANAVEIARAYRARAKQTHPDLNGGSAQSAREFVAVGRAYEILKDPLLRAEYDRQLAGRGVAPSRDLFDKGITPRDEDDLRRNFAERTADLYRDFKYTPEDLARYMEAAARMAKGNGRSGDASTVFNFNSGAGSSGATPALTAPVVQQLPDRRNG